MLKSYTNRPYKNIRKESHMSHIKTKNKFYRLMACAMVLSMIFSHLTIFKASAEENYFIAEGGTLEFDEAEPEQRTIWIKLKAAREMTIHYLEGYFTPVNDDEELAYGFGDISAVFPGMGGNSCSLNDGWFYWSAEEYMDPSISSEGIHVQAGDAVFEVAYDVKAGVEVVKRNMPVTLELAVIDDGTEVGKQIQDITLDATLIAGTSYGIYYYVGDHGSIDAPATAIGGTELEVKIIPDDGYELWRLERNYSYATDDVADNVYKTIVDGTLHINVEFWRVFQIDNDTEYVQGDDNGLAIRFSDDVDDFYGTGVLQIDDEYVDLDEDVEYDDANKIITIKKAFLDELSLGEHKIEALFSDPEHGVARSGFTIVKKDEEEEDVPLVPDTGFLTKNTEGATEFTVIGLSLASFMVATYYYFVKRNS